MSARNGRFYGKRAAKTRRALAIGHVSSCERCLTPPRSAMFRMAVGHVSHDERPSIAMREVEFEGRNVDTKTQPFDYKHVAKTRRESRISAKYFCRGKEMCSLQYRLLRFLTPTPESASWLPIHPTTSDGKSHVGQQPYHGVSTPRTMGVPSSLI